MAATKTSKPRYNDAQRAIWKRKSRDSKTGSIRKYGSAFVLQYTSKGTQLVPLTSFDETGRYTGGDAIAEQSGGF